MNSRVKCINSPYADIQTQINRNAEMLELEFNEDVDNYNLAQMIPKVTYDDWIVCHYTKDDKLYRIDEESIIEVKCTEVLEYNSDFNVIKENGEPMEEEEFFDYCDNLCAGEADDMTCYVYFEEFNKGE
jgi:hypothetical protein